MNDVLQFGFLGLGLGSLYALFGHGLVLIYRGSGVLNFAHGAIGVVGAYVAWDLRVRGGAPAAISLVVGVLTSMAIGGVAYAAVIRPLRRAAPLSRIVATLGILLILQSLVVLRYGNNAIAVPDILPVGRIEFGGGVGVSVDRVLLFVIALVLTAGLWALYRFTKFGIGTTAVAENPRAAAALGWSTDRVAVLNWAIGSGLAGLAAVLVSPIIQLTPGTMTLLVLAAMSAALIGGFRSFPVTFVAAMLIGIAETEVQRFVKVPGVASSLPFIVIAVTVLVSGRALPLRDFLLQRLPAVGSGRTNLAFVVIGVVGTCVALATAPDTWLQSLSVTFAMALILLSLVVVTGYAGQISLAQYVVAGFGAYVSGRLIFSFGWGFEPAIVAGVLGGAAFGALLAIPAMRSRGMNLAIVTLGLGLAVELMLFNNGDFTGGLGGTPIGTLELFGVSFDPFIQARRYVFLCLAMFVVGGFVVSNLRRSGSGRRLLAVRTNERAAASLGLSSAWAKLHAFAVSGALAAMGGMLLAFQGATIVYSQFTNFTSVSAVAWAFIGGIGFISGPLLGATLAPGALGTQIGDSLLGGVADYVPLIGGVVLIALLLINQDGIAGEQARQFAAVKRRFVKRRTPRPPPVLQAVKDESIRVIRMRLTVDDLSVQFGGVRALTGVSLTVDAGEIVGLIGPNGAGKTTLIDSVTGFVKPTGGAIRLEEQDLGTQSAAARARFGLSRTFQSLELFEDLTVLDNLRIAADKHGIGSSLRDLVLPKNPPLPAEVGVAITEFGLSDLLDHKVSDLPYGQRRLLGLARAVATRPSVLLLDEPAAGLRRHESLELAALVRRLATDWGMAVLLVEHDMEFVMGICDRIVVLDFGAKIADDLPREIRSNPRVIAAYLGTETDALSEEAR